MASPPCLTKARVYYIPNRVEEWATFNAHDRPSKPVAQYQGAEVALLHRTSVNPKLKPTALRLPNWVTPMPKLTELRGTVW